MKNLNKQQFLEAVKEDPSLLLLADIHLNNQWEGVVLFSHCCEPFTVEEYNDLCKEFSCLQDLEAFTLRPEHMIEVYCPIPPLKGESVFSPKNIGRTYKTGVPKERLEEFEKEIFNVKVNLNEAEIVSKETIQKDMPRHTIRHFSVVDEREIKQTAARELWDKITNSRNPIEL